MTETVTVAPDPAPQNASLAGDPTDPQVVTLDTETTALLLLTSCLVAVGVGVLTVASFSGRG